MSVSLYRKYRPQTFSDLIGQSPAVSVLTNSIIRGKIGHAYLFSGSRGCGKTSAARIFAKALNCLDRKGFEPCGKCRNCTEITAGESLDVIEIDGASNNGVDNIRGLKENVTLSPFNSRYKIYIIDEVHMLSQGAFNALLKTLEEPPEHVIFIMATTEPHKVPVTIRSRCQHIPFRSITPDDIFARLEYVCKSEGITYDAEGLREISRHADGALRDGLSLLEQVSASGDVTLTNVENVFGAGSRPAFERWIVGFREHSDGSYPELKAMFDAGASSVRVFEELFSLLRDLWLVSRWKNVADALGLSSQEKDFLVDEASHWKPDDLQNLMSSALDVLTEARLGVRTDILLGMFMLRIDGNHDLDDDSDKKPHIIPKAPPVETQAPVQPSPVQSNPVQPHEDDQVLKAELLNAAFERNFLIHCALYDASTYVEDNELVIHMSHRYCYSVMCIDNFAADMTEIFSVYSRVILRYGLAEYVCPRRPVKSDTVTPTITAAVTPPITSPEPRMPLLPPSSETSSRLYSHSSTTAFSRLMTGLASMGLKPEILTLKRGEATDDYDDTDNTEGDNDE